MVLRRYPPARTALLLVDPFNDFLSEGGKLWPQIREAAEAVDLLANLRALVETARGVGVTVFHLPHRRWREGDFDGWRHPTPWQLTIDREALFAHDTWGGDWHPDLAPQQGDIVIQEHWGQNGFFNTDLDLQLKQHGRDTLVVAGLTADLCVAATARYGTELGYHITIVHDATVPFDPTTRAMHAARRFAQAVHATADLVAILGAT